MDDQQRARELSSPEDIAFRLRNLAQNMTAGNGPFARDHQAWKRVEELADATAALRAAPEGLGPLSPVEHVRYWAEAYGPQATEPHFQGHGVVAHLLAEYADLLERLAARPQGVKDAG